MPKVQFNEDNKTWGYPNGAEFDQLWEFYSHEILGMCGCGQPEEAYNFLRQTLIICDRRGCHEDINPKPWVYAEEEIEKLILADPKITAHALLHLLNGRKVTEHGGSIGGSWLSDLGHELVDAGEATETEDEA